MNYSFICYVISTIFAVVGVLLLISEELDLAGLTTTAWLGISFVFFVVAHYIQGAIK